MGRSDESCLDMYVSCTYFFFNIYVCKGKTKIVEGIRTKFIAIKKIGAAGKTETKQTTSENRLIASLMSLKFPGYGSRSYSCSQGCAVDLKFEDVGEVGSSGGASLEGMPIQCVCVCVCESRKGTSRVTSKKSQETGWATYIYQHIQIVLRQVAQGSPPCTKSIRHAICGAQDALEEQPRDKDAEPAESSLELEVSAERSREAESNGHDEDGDELDRRVVHATVVRTAVGVLLHEADVEQSPEVVRRVEEEHFEG